MKALQERLDIEKQTWEENYKKKEVCAALCCICSHSLLLFFRLKCGCCILCQWEVFD